MTYKYYKQTHNQNGSNAFFIDLKIIHTVAFIDIRHHTHTHVK